MRLPGLTLGRLAGALMIVASIGFSMVNIIPGYFTGICGFCVTYPLYDVVVGNLLTTVYYGITIIAFIAGTLVILSTDYDKVLVWIACFAGLVLVLPTSVLTGFSVKDELVPESLPAAAFFGALLLAMSAPLALVWGRRPSFALATIGFAVVAAAAYPPVVDRIPFHPSATNMLQATMELTIVGHPLVMTALAVFSASAALGAPRRLVTGLAAAPLLAVAYASYHVAEIIASSTRWIGPIDAIVQSGLYIIAGAAVAGAVMLVAVAAFVTRPGST